MRTDWLVSQLPSCATLPTSPTHRAPPTDHSLPSTRLRRKVHLTEKRRDEEDVSGDEGVLLTLRWGTTREEGLCNRSQVYVRHPTAFNVRITCSCWAADLTRYCSVPHPPHPSTPTHNQLTHQCCALYVRPQRVSRIAGSLNVHACASAGAPMRIDASTRARSCG